MAHRLTPATCVRPDLMSQIVARLIVCANDRSVARTRLSDIAGGTTAPEAGLATMLRSRQRPRMLWNVGKRRCKFHGLASLLGCLFDLDGPTGMPEPGKEPTSVVAPGGRERLTGQISIRDWPR